MENKKNEITHFYTRKRMSGGASTMVKWVIIKYIPEDYVYLAKPVNTKTRASSRLFFEKSLVSGGSVEWDAKTKILIGEEADKEYDAINYILDIPKLFMKVAGKLTHDDAKLIIETLNKYI